MVLRNLDVPFANSEVARRASELLRWHAQKDGWQPSLPVPIEAIIERTLDLNLLYDDLSEHGENVLGALYPTERRICLNEKYRPNFDVCRGFERFTQAHEVGHWEMHVDVASTDHPTLFDIDDEVFICRDGDHDAKEHTANRFAARLLMPEDLVRSELSSYSLASRERFRDFASKIGVSFAALHIRLNELHIPHQW